MVELVTWFFESEGKVVTVVQLQVAVGPIAPESDDRMLLIVATQNTILHADQSTGGNLGPGH